MVATITERQDADAGEHGGPGHRAHPLDPGAMIVDAGRRRDLHHPRAQAGEIERGAGLHPRHDDARHRQLIDRQPGAEPGLQQLCGLILAERAHLDDPCLASASPLPRRPYRVEIAACLRRT
jgi:hypothetical protein